LSINWVSINRRSINRVLINRVLINRVLIIRGGATYVCTNTVYFCWLKLNHRMHSSPPPPKKNLEIICT
jgi:hypothetical protein